MNPAEVGRYRVKVIEVQAIQVLCGENDYAVAKFIANDDELFIGTTYFEISGRNGDSGDYAVKFGGGDFTIMARELFEATFEGVSDHEPAGSHVSPP